MDLPFRWIVYLIVLCAAHSSAVMYCDLNNVGCTTDGQFNNYQVGEPIR